MEETNEPKVVSCVELREKNGKKIYHVALSDNTGGESFAVPIPIGTPKSQLIIEPSQWGPRVKMKSNGGNKYSGGGFNRGRSGPTNESLALSYAKDLVVGGKVPIEGILSSADKLYNWLESKASASETKSQPQ